MKYIVMELEDEKIINIEVPENGGEVHLPKGKVISMPMITNCSIIGYKEEG